MAYGEPKHLIIQTIIIPTQKFKVHAYSYKQINCISQSNFEMTQIVNSYNFDDEMFLHNKVIESLSMLSFQDLNLLEDLSEPEINENIKTLGNEFEIKSFFDEEDLEEWISEDDDLSDKSILSDDMENLVECVIPEDDLDNGSNLDFDVEEFTEWINEEAYDEKNSSSNGISVPDMQQLQVTTIESNEQVDYGSNYKITKPISRSLIENKTSKHDTFELFQMLDSYTLRTEISREKVLHCRVLTPNSSTAKNKHKFYKSFNLDSLRTRRFTYDLDESQKRLNNFATQTSSDIQRHCLLSKRVSLDENTFDGPQKRHKELLNNAPKNNRSALAA